MKQFLENIFKTKKAAQGRAAVRAFRVMRKQRTRFLWFFLFRAKRKNI